MKTRLLLIDDEKQFIEPLSERLKNRGFNVDVAVNGDQALHMIHNNRYEVVLLDVLMPGESGLKIYTKIRKVDQSIPVIMLTGHADMKTAIKEVRNGVFDYLIKPIQIDELIETIHLALEHRLNRPKH